MFLTCEVRTVDGESVGVLVLSEKTFASGNKGYHGQAKLELDGARYQSQCQMVRIEARGDGDDDNGNG